MEKSRSDKKKYVEIYLANWVFYTTQDVKMVAKRVVTPYLNIDYLRNSDYHVNCALKEFGENSKTLTNTFQRDENNRIKVHTIIYTKYISESELTEEEFLQQFPEDGPIVLPEKGRRSRDESPRTIEEPPSDGLFVRNLEDAGERPAEGPDVADAEQPGAAVQAPDIRAVAAPARDNKTDVGAGAVNEKFDWNDF